MKKFAVILLSVMILCGSVIAAGASGFRDPLGFTYDADSLGNLTVTAFDGVYMDVPSNYLQMPVIKINNFAFQKNTSLLTLSFEKATNLKTIGTFAFEGCTSLDSVNIPWGISSVSVAAFKGCTSMTDVEFYSNGGKINAECFANCTSLKNVTIGNEITTINASAFANCSSLEYLELSPAVTKIDATAFRNTPVTLGVYYGSYAQTFALDNGIPYVLLDNKKLGDANADGSVSVSDVTSIQRHIAELEELKGISFKAGDVNCDGKIDVNDATSLQQFLAEFTVDYPIDELITQ